MNHPRSLYSGPVKRLLDILASAALLVLLAPVMLLTWVAVRLVLGKPALYRVSAPYGLIETDLPVGEHQIDVRMGWTPVRLVGAAVSGAVLFLVVVLLVWPVRK